MSPSTELTESLLGQVIRPLMQGGRVEPIEPIGEARAVGAVASLTWAAGPAASACERERGRLARTLLPVDTLRPFGAAEWLLACALNDLLQATNPSFDSRLFGTRRDRVLQVANRMIDRAGAPATLADVLGRHVVFSRVGELVRIDTDVVWWTGRQSFRGRRPPERLLAWPALRRVRLRERTVPLGRMAEARGDFSDGFQQTLARWLRASPLTDLCGADRDAPAFRWCGASLGVLGSHAGRALTLRALARGPGDPGKRRRVLVEAGAELPSRARALLAPFFAQLDAARADDA